MSAESKIDELLKAGDTVNLILSETRLQFDTLTQLQAEERKNMLQQTATERDTIRKHYFKVIIALVATLLIIIGCIIGVIFYLVSNYEIAVVNGEQEAYAETYSKSEISDGIKIGLPQEMWTSVIGSD